MSVQIRDGALHLAEPVLAGPSPKHDHYLNGTPQQHSPINRKRSFNLYYIQLGYKARHKHKTRRPWRRTGQRVFGKVRSPSVVLVLVLNHVLRRLEIGQRHLLDERVKINFALPAQLLLGLGRISEEQPRTRQCIKFL